MRYDNCHYKEKCVMIIPDENMIYREDVMRKEKVR